MYIYYTHTKDAAGSVVLTELKLTSVHNRWQIYWKNSTENALFQICSPLLKAPPIAKRSYDENSKIWTYFDQYGVRVLAQIAAITATLGGVTQIEVPDLQSIAQASVFDPHKARPSIRPEDFFYQTTAPQTTELTAEQIQRKLALLLEIEVSVLAVTAKDDLKKLYRRAALRLHPDRNNGDGSRMSDLNMYWRMYNV